MSRTKYNKNQLSLLPPEQPTVEEKQLDLEEVVISHKRNFGIGKPYILEHLSQYNNYLKRPSPGTNAPQQLKNQYSRYLEHLKDDNLFLRKMFGGIENSPGTPPEIFDGFNALETCLIEAGIFKRKSVFLYDFYVQPTNMHREPIKVRRDPEKYAKQSRIKIDGHLDGKSLYEVVEHLLTASQIKPIFNRYKKDWKEIFQLENPGKKQKRFKRANLYDPETLKQRMDHIEREYPEAVETFKDVLAQPFIPERIVVRMDEHGNQKEVRDPHGFVTPGKTYRQGVKGRSFWNLREYAEKVFDYFQQKETALYKKQASL